MTDLSVIVVSANSEPWLTRCFETLFAHRGDIELELIVVDSGSTDGTCQLVREQYPNAELVVTENHGFAHGNNRGFEVARGRYVLLLNPDTEIKSGYLSDLITYLDRCPEVGLVGVRQVDADGKLLPTIRRFPNALRMWGDELGFERLPNRPSALGERELQSQAYDRDVECDWTVGSFMLIRCEALAAAGLMDERFFLYSEETDLCLRVRAAGWQIRHLPMMTILHHAGKGGVQPRMVAQSTFARKQYARKHFSALHRAAFMTALLGGALARAVAPGNSPAAAVKRQAAWESLRVVLGRAASPFAPPPATALTGTRPAAMPVPQLEEVPE